MSVLIIGNDRLDRLYLDLVALIQPGQPQQPLGHESLCETLEKTLAAIKEFDSRCEKQEKKIGTLTAAKTEFERNSGASQLHVNDLESRLKSEAKNHRHHINTLQEQIQYHSTRAQGLQVSLDSAKWNAVDPATLSELEGKLDFKTEECQKIKQNLGKQISTLTKQRNLAQKRREESEADEPKKKKKKGHCCGVMKKLAKQMRKLIEIVIQYEDQDGRILSGPFMKLPSRKELPDYYEVIRKPVDITKILTKIDDGKYDDMDMMVRDFDQLCLNTQKYNEDGSLIHEDSIVLQSVFTNAREKLQAEWKDDDKEEEDEESSHAPSVASNKMEEGDSEDVSLASTPKPPKKKKKEKEPKEKKKRKSKKKQSSDEEEDEDY